MFTKTTRLICAAVTSLSMILCCGCSGNKTSIGPETTDTGVYIRSETGEVLKKPLRMIKAGGKLYYDTGKPAGESDASVLELKTAGESYEIPQNDGECNFEGMQGYQDSTGITKIVISGEERTLFKMFDDPELDMSVYKYCFYLKGHLPNAANAGELVVLTEDMDINYEKFMDKMLSSTVSPADEKYRTTFRVYGDTDKMGLSLVARNVTANGMTIECEQFGGEVSGNLQTGDWYLLEVNNNDEWVPVATKLGEADYAWSLIAYGIPQNEITTIEVDWTWLYGSLPPGYYRMTKEITDFRMAGNFDKEMYYIHFTVGE